jgi:hypothetical protein
MTSTDSVLISAFAIFSPKIGLPRLREINPSSFPTTIVKTVPESADISINSGIGRSWNPAQWALPHSRASRDRRIEAGQHRVISGKAEPGPKITNQGRGGAQLGRQRQLREPDVEAIVVVNLSQWLIDASECCRKLEVESCFGFGLIVNS